MGGGAGASDGTLAFREGLDGTERERRSFVVCPNGSLLISLACSVCAGTGECEKDAEMVHHE